ncbi:LacI family DNA-binding transcriptional regulator, partial [Chloroflexota bacterium]
MRRNRKSITIHDVAAAAGVSVSTVSRVLNDKDDVSAQTYERVQHVIRELGYASSLAARGMRSLTTNVIGLIMPDVAEPFSYSILQGVNRAIAQLDYDLIVYTNGDISKNTSADQESYYVSLLNGSITDGVIVVTPAATNFSTAAPVVAIDPNNESPECPAIISTNRKGALEAMQYLTGLGHRRIGFI